MKKNSWEEEKSNKSFKSGSQRTITTDREKEDESRRSDEDSEGEEGDDD
jgi:hypothetical protein